MLLGARAVLTCVAEEVVDNVSVRKQRLQGKEKLGAMVVLRFFAERWVAKWTVAAARRCPARKVSTETERGSTMYRRT